jgi:hypothetical protein
MLVMEEYLSETAFDYDHNMMHVIFCRKRFLGPVVRPPVGASTLAMDVNDDAGCLMPHGVLESIASMLAPTEKTSPMKKGR